MRILIDIGHPGHVHFFKNAVWELQKKGHEVFFSARDKDVTISLLKHYRFDYRTLSTIGTGRWGLYREFIQREIALVALMKKYKPAIVTGIGGEFVAPVSKLLGIPSVIFTDTEIATIDKYLTYPIADTICTPACFRKDIGKRHIRYDGYHELAYLSPDYFKPDPGVLKKIGVERNEPFIILRFVAWRASHDMGQQGLSLEQKRIAVQTLKQYGRVFITSEGTLPKDLEAFRLYLPAHCMHDFMYYAKLVLGEGATMATEAGILGTPAVYSSPVAFELGNFIELMDRYQLVYSYQNFEEALAKGIDILNKSDSKQKWHIKQKQMLTEKINVTQFIADILANYPLFNGETNKMAGAVTAKG